MEVTESKREKMKRARRRLEELKGFYWHLAIYMAVNSFITISKIGSNLGEWEAFKNDFWDFSTFAVWFFWGIGLAFHAIKVFSLNPVFGKGWEERQIRKFIEKEKNEAEKYTNY